MKMLRRIAPLVLLCLGLSVGMAVAAYLPAAAQDLQPAAPGGQSDLRVNELMADNKNTLVDPDEPAETPDWLELYNPGPDPVSLDGLGLADGEPLEAGFAITNGLSIPAGGFALFYADSDPKQGPYHTNFKLNNVDGEAVILYVVATKTIIDRIDFPALATDQAYGRVPDGTGTPTYLRIATPGISNQSDPPHVSDVTKPAYPALADVKFTVSATVTDTQDSGALTVTLHYSSSATGPTAVPMAVVGANRYAADIPALPANTLVSYYVAAVDTTNELSRWPLLGREYRYLTGYVAPNLLINEIVVWNNSIPDPDEPAETPDWIELYNPTAEVINLDGLSVTDDKDKPLRFRLPDGLTIAPKHMLMLLADDDAGQNIGHIGQPPVHLNFNLNKSDAYVGLFGGEGTVKIDSHSVKNTPLLGSVGRIPDGGEWSADPLCPTYGAENMVCANAVYLSTIKKP